MNFLFLDTETTGLNEPRLVSLAFNIWGTQLISQGYYKPPKPIEEGASKVNGLTNEMMANEQPFTGSKDFLHLQQLLDQLVLVAHNAVFDVRVLHNEGLKVKRSICTKELAQAIYTNLPKHNLQFLREQLGLTMPGVIAHSAVGDVIIMKRLWQTMYKEKMKDWNDAKRVQAYFGSFMKNYS